MSEIPFSWCKAPLGQIAEKITKGTTPTTNGFSFQKDGINFIKVENLVDGRISLETVKDYISEPAHQAQSRSALKRGDVLFSIAGTIGEIATVEQIHLPANTNQALAIISGFDGAVTAKFLEFQLKSFASREITGRARGGAMNNISLGDLRELTVRVAPTKEQPRIVAKIEELFSELDKGVESLTTAREQLKVYRQAVLKHAYEGMLTAAWRESRVGEPEPARHLLERLQAASAASEKSRKVVAPLTAEQLLALSDLPSNWAWCKLNDLAVKITDGEHFRPDVKPTGIHFLSAKDVHEHGVCLNETLFVDEETARKARLRCDPQRGDILVVSRGATVGRLCTVDVDSVFCLLGSVILIKPSAEIKSKYLESALKSPSINRAMRDTSGSTAQQAIYLRDVQHLPIPICPVEEQDEIVQTVNECLSVGDELDRLIQQEIRRAESLRSSILTAAFAGQLVPQDPNDEPAWILLERIRVARQEDIDPKRSTKRQKKQSI